MAFTFLRLREVLRRRGISRSTHYDDIDKGLYTKAVPLRTRAIGWPDYEVDALNAALIAGKSDDEIRALVQELTDKRQFAS